MKKLNLQESKVLFLRTGFCKHEAKYYETSEPPNCGLKITQCGVCGKRISLIYLT